MICHQSVKKTTLLKTFYQVTPWHTVPATRDFIWVNEAKSCDRGGAQFSFCSGLVTQTDVQTGGYY